MGAFVTLLLIAVIRPCNSLIIVFTIYNDPVWRAGEGRRPWAPLFPLPGHILAFFPFRQPWATTISPSEPPHLTLPGKTAFLNGILRAFKVRFSKIQPRHAINICLNHYISVLIWNKVDSFECKQQNFFFCKSKFSFS